MTLMDNCPPDCAAVLGRKMACIVHDAKVPEVVLAERLRAFLASTKGAGRDSQ